MTHFIRILFPIAIMALAISYAMQEDVYANGPTYVTLLIAVPSVLSVVLVCVDMFWDRKRLHVLSGLFFGVLAGLVFAYILSLVVDLATSIFPSPPEVARPVAPVDVTGPEYVTAQQQYAEQLEAWREYTSYDKTVNMIKLVLGASAVFFCVTIVMQTKDDFRFVIPYVQFSRKSKGARPLLLDTSVIIDGRIADIAETGVIESEVIIPRFVLAELQAVADSEDKLKRNRGRRGLDVLNRLQSGKVLEVQILDPHGEQIERAGDVDAKLVALAQELDGRILTHDYNLNKVAKLRGVDVVNLNDLANALKPVFLPGEGLKVRIIKPGEEAGQGVGYLDDGTMVVVEQAREQINREVHIIVTSVLQTSAGRMVFGRIDPDRTFRLREKAETTS